MKIKNNFMNIPEKFSAENSKISIIPVAYNESSTWLKGCDKGPAAIINASANVELYDIDADYETYRLGIFTDKLIKEKKVGDMIKAVKDKVKKNLESGKFNVILGGEHTVSIGAVKAYAEFYDKLSVLQLDAHSDSREKYNGSRFSHACTMARIKEICPAVQAGIRSMGFIEKEKIDFNNVFFMKEILGKKWMDKVISRLSDNVYVTIDLDVFDDSIMASVGNPEPGGMLWYEVVDFLYKLSKSRKIVGFDVVELCPNKYNKAPDFLAAKLIYTFLSYIMKDNKR